MQDKQIIISVGREYGSGGHAIAEVLSRKFELSFYDRNLLEEIALHKDVDVKNLEKYDETPKVPFLSRTIRGFNNSPEENIAMLQFDFLRKMANEGKSFVIVGRCSENVLKDFPGLISFYIIGDQDVRIERIMQIYGLSKAQATDKVHIHDKNRKAYHDHYCDWKWGDSRNYDCSINSSRLGIDETADMLGDYIRRRIVHIE